jgi:hypothetical protein
MKICRHCGEQKDKSEFPVHREKGSGLSSWCRTCHAEACAKWRAEHPEKVDAYNAKRRAEYAAMREAEDEAARKELNKRLREQVRRMVNVTSGCANNGGRRRPESNCGSAGAAVNGLRAPGSSV